MLMPCMDPAQWREETERVASKLKNEDARIRQAADSRDHLAVLKQFARSEGSNRDNGDNILNNSKSDSTSRRTENGNKDSYTGGDRKFIIENLGQLKCTLSSQISALMRNENILNSREKMHILSAEYGENKKVQKSPHCLSVLYVYFVTIWCFYYVYFIILFYL
jgi:hypothetical protein